MKKFNFKTLLLAIGLVVASVQPMWAFYIAGDEALTGYNWCGNCANMGSSNEITFKEIPAGTYQFKLTDGTNWSGDNTNLVDSYSGTITSQGIKDSKNMYITTNETSNITFNVTNTSTWRLSVTGTVVDRYITTDGWCGSAWTADAQKLTYSSTNKNYSYTINNVEAGEHKIKVTNGTWDKTWGGTAFNSASGTATKKDADSEGNAVFGLSCKSNVTITFSNSTEKFTISATAVTYTVTFGAKGTYGTSSVTATANSTSISSGASVNDGSQVVFTANPAIGYEVEGWYSDASCTSAISSGISQDKSTYTISSLSAAASAYAKFQEKTWNVIAAAGTGCASVSPTVATSMGQITGGSITSTASTGYEFDSWSSSNGGTFTSQAANTTFKPTGNATVTANYKEKSFAVTISADNSVDASASVSPPGSQTIKWFNGTQVTATPSSAAYVFDHWEKTSDIFIDGTGATVTVTAHGTGTLTAYFRSAATYSLNVTSTTGGSITTPAGGSYSNIEHGTAYSIVASKNDGYTFTGWTAGQGEDVTFGNASYLSTSATVNSGNATVTANFSANTNTAYTVKHYKQNLSGDGYELADTDNLTGTTDAQVTPDVKDYDGFTAPSTQTVTIKGDGSTTVTYNYTRNSYTLTWAGLEGAATQGGTPAGSVKYGATLTAPTLEKTGYNFTCWSPSVPATMPAANSTYTAQWEEILYTITLTNATVVSVQAGIATHPSITANAAPVGQKFKQWNTTGGATVANATSATTTVSATAEGTIMAVYEDVPTVFFDNTNTNWSNVFVYLMKNDAWNKTGNDKGVAMGTTYVQESHQMTQIGTSNIYYYSYTTVSLTQYIAFSDANMSTWGEFHGNNGAYRGDFASCQPLFIPDGTHNKTNETEYYSDGRWTSYSTASEIYMVGIDGDWSERAQYQFEKETITGTSYTLDVTLSEVGHNYTFKLRKCGDGEWYGVNQNETAITSNHCTDIQFYGGNDYANCTLISTVAGTYTFTYDITTKKLSVEYPAMPAPESITVTAERYFGEDKIDNFIATEPYKVYTDEKIVLTIAAVEAPTGCTTYYQFGENAASTERTYTITNPTTTADQSIEAKVFFRPNAGGEDGEAATETINYQGVAYPKLNLTASWNEKEENAVVDNQTVTITCSADDAADVAATVTADGYEDWNVTSYPSQKVYTLPDKSLHRYDFTATATANSRTFTATTSVSVYRLVKITVTDPNGLMNHYYMWVQGSNPMQEEQAWPGSTFYSKLGNAHIFYVKYPSYTHFVLNDGKTGDGAKQTVDVALPDQSACYTIGTQVAEGDDKDKYQVNSGDCPNPLYVGDIADVSMFNGEGKLVQPEVDTDPDLDMANLNISVTFGTANIVTYDQRGTGFMLTALSRGTTTAIVTYSIPGATDVVKNFDVTVGEAITIQAKIGTNLGWNSHENIWIKYWGTDGEHNTQMKFVKYVAGEDEHGADGQDYYTARLPMPDGSSKIRFKIGYPNGTSWDEAWRNSAEVPDVDKSGCYTVYYVAGDNANRGISRDGDNCFVDYQVEIDMISGITYFSNKVDNNTDIVSFFAPGSDKTGYEGGSVRIMKNGEQSAMIPAETFATSGVYTAKISGDGTGLAEVALYTGDYYIRTDAAADNNSALSTGWDDYKKPSHKFTQFSLYPDAKYNYYWVRNNKRTSDETHFNVKGTVGNEYNPDLANMISVNDYTDGNGDIVQDQTFGVNLRFGYNPQTNYFERAILKGAGDNYFLNIQGDNVYNDTECSAQVLNETNYNTHPEYSKFNDVSDWVYEKLIFVNITGSAPSAQVVLKSKSFNNKIMYQLGYGVDDHGRATKTPIQKVIMGSGTAQGKYALRVIYDYKTNRLSASWEPSGEIDKVMQVDADILFVSNEGNDVKEITFAGDSTSARLTSLQSVMYVLELENTYDPKTSAPDAQYWIALPFECKISDIFGIENYITLDENRIAQSGYWGIMRYRGDLRAQKGWFIEDTPDGFWEWMYPTETLIPGEGYVLYVEKSSLSWNSITVEEPCEDGEGCTEGKKSVQKYVKRFYFPSLVEGFTMNKSTDASSKVTYPNQPCNITSPVDRRAEDSNWKVIAPKSYNNVTIKSAEEQEYALDGPNFIYEYNEHAAKGSRYTPKATEGFEFKAFHGYMAQYGGTITWNPYSKTEHPTSAPYYGEEPSFKGGMLTIELVQNNEQLDCTFVKLSKNGTEGFDQNLDLTKITESCSQIASVSENVVYAGNTLPLNTELVPLNVKVTAKGTYDIALSESLNGLEVNLYDAFEQTTTPLDMMSATITLDKGEYKDRFYLQLKQKGSDTPTSFDGKLEQYNLPTDKTQKLLINDQIYLINAGRIYNASGTKVK